MQQASSKLPVRWTPIREKGIKPLSGQRLAFWLCTARFIIVAAGRRSLKTELSKRKLVRIACRTRKPWNARYAYCLPTDDQAREVAWGDLKALVPRDMVLKIDEDGMVIYLINGNELHARGLNKAQRMEGHPWDGLVIDERADIKKNFWHENLRPLLSDRGGFCWHIGVPDFRGPSNEEFKDLFARGLSDDPKDANFASFAWLSEDILPEHELAEVREEMDPRTYRQEYCGSWENAPGRAYEQFVRSRNVDGSLKYWPLLPLHVACDFNYGHHYWIIWQLVNGEVHVLDQIYGVNKFVEQMSPLLQERLQELRGEFPDEPNAFREGNLVFDGDYAGTQKQASQTEATKDTWRQIKKAFPNAEFVIKPNPLISDRVRTTNAFLCNANEVARLKIHPRVKGLIRDYENVEMSSLYSESGKSGDLTHASDALGYPLWRLYKKER